MPSRTRERSRRYRQGITSELQSNEGACYATFKQHLRYSKDRIQLVQSRSLRAPTKEDTWDHNQNCNPNKQAHPTNSSPNRNLKRTAEITTPKKIVKHRAKWEEDSTISNIPQDEGAGMMDMPSEILEKVIQYLPFRQRIHIQRTNQRIKGITLGAKMWKTITIQDSRLTTIIMKKILRERPTFLNLPGCTWNLTPQEEIMIENYLLIYEPRLTYLGLQSYRGINSIIATAIFLAKKLSTLDLSESSFG